MIFRDKIAPESLSIFLLYLASMEKGQAEQLPALSELSEQLGISIASLREQLEVARALGLVEVRPRTGIRMLPYSFLPAVLQSLAFAMRVDPECFHHYSDLRNHIEKAYWSEAVALLTPKDHDQLRSLINRAWQKLRGNPIQIPH